jgi:Tfp pilus assembly PilM family ATPase
VPGRNAVVKLLNVPAQGEKAGDLPLHDLLGLTDDAHYRIGYEILGPGTSRSDSRLLAVAVPEAQAQAVCRLFPSGTPAPCSMEIAGLAVMTAFQHGPGGACAGECVGIVDFGASVSVLAIFNRGVLVLIRKFDFGTEAILKRVQESLGVDAETAQGILADGSFDVSQVAREVMAGFTQQLIISRDFVERRENCRMRKLYASGGVVGARDWQAEVQATVGLVPEPWNPFEGLSLAPGAVPDTLRGMEPRFAAAVGAALGSLEAE